MMADDKDFIFNFFLYLPILLENNLQVFATVVPMEKNHFSFAAIF
jgi:hypothetical protein